MHFPAEDPFYQRMYLWLQILCQPQIQRCAPGFFYPGRGLRADDGILQTQLYRRFVSEFGYFIQSQLHDGADLRNGAQTAHPAPFSRIYPCEGDSRSGSPSDSEAWLSGRPYERESGDGYGGGAAGDCAQQTPQEHFETHASDTERHHRE